MSNRTGPGREHSRVLIYSHDTFGLGHLRRCRTIAHSLVERHKDLSVLILSGSPIIGSFDFRSRVDFVRIPGVIKLRNGEYTSLNLHIDIDEMLAMRASIIRHTADIFDPDLFIVDKEPLGLRGEVLETLQLLKSRGTPLVLGLRDVMDEPSALAPEWERKKVAAGARQALRRVLGLRPAADLRSAGRHQGAAVRPQEDGLYRLSGTQRAGQCAPQPRDAGRPLHPGHPRRRRRWRGPGRLGAARL